MLVKASRSIHTYYLSVLVLAFIAFGAGVKYFWDNGPFNVENLNSAFEASLHFDELKKKDGLNQVKTFVNNDRARDGILRLNTLDKRTKTLNSFNKVSSYDNFQESLASTKKSINELISYPQMNSVVMVLANKVSSFQSFVVQNNWRTLTRISKRVKSRISGRSVQTPGFFTSRKLELLLRVTKKDVEQMKTVTMGSVLKDTDKQTIVAKLNTFNTELSMLERYVTTLGNFNGSFKTLETRYKTWFNDVAPQIVLTKLKMEKDTQNMAFALLGLGGFLFLALIGGVFVYRYNSRKGQKEVEARILKFVQDGLFPLENKVTENASSEDFNREFERCREYFHKRISFGTVFQEAVPFSSILLDSNLNVSWANELFYEHWNLDETHREGSSISWDFLQQYTNLGEDDPVLMAHNQGIAGIYQIQVKDPRTEESLPYEMYVSPVEYSKQKRIMIFFYPLRGLEETLSIQTKSIVGPIRKTLDSFVAGEFTSSTIEKLHKDFEVAGIGELFDKFQDYYRSTQNIREELMQEIQSLENSVNDQLKLISDLEAYNHRKVNLVSDTKKNFENTKAAIIHNIDLRYDLESVFNTCLNISKLLLKEETNLMNDAIKSRGILEENGKAFASVNNTKEDFKVLKGSMDELRARLNQSLEQTLMFMKKEGIDPKFESSIGKVRMEMKGVEQILQNFSKVLRNLDVALGKMALITQQVEPIDFSQVDAIIQKAGREIEDMTFEFGKINRSGQRSDDTIVMSLKELHNSFTTNTEIDFSAIELVANYRDEESESEVIFTEDQELTESVERGLDGGREVTL
ncbi:MAG: hypothetical protein VXV96_16645 [Bdellovibrionota bacterium]|nr:hypothetical protein [Bdellovibrionota bacterium]